MDSTPERAGRLCRAPLLASVQGSGVVSGFAVRCPCGRAPSPALSKGQSCKLLPQNCRHINVSQGEVQTVDCDLYGHTRIRPPQYRVQPQV